MKKKRVSVILNTLLATLLAFAGVIAPAAPASAAPSCYGSSCEGLNPQSTSCVNDARTLLSRNAVTSSGNWGVLELRYSPSCYSNWVRFTPWYGIRASIGAILGGVVDGSPYIWRQGVANSLRGRIGSSGALGWGYTNWTAMVTAAGTTCSSVEVYSTAPSSSGQGTREKLGTYNAPCIS